MFPNLKNEAYFLGGGIQQKDLRPKMLDLYKESAL